MATTAQKAAAMYVSEKPALIPHLILIALSVAPLIIHVPTNFNVVATASLAVYCGCWRSVKATGENSSCVMRLRAVHADGCPPVFVLHQPRPMQYHCHAAPTETMSKSDAMRFPLVGSCVLFGLFLLFKFLPARFVNALLSFYLGGVAVFVLVSAVTPYVKDFFPEVNYAHWSTHVAASGFLTLRIVLGFS